MKFSIVAIQLSWLVALTHAQYVPEDFESVVLHAEAGDAYHQSILGEIYYQGERGDVDLDKATYWFEQAAVQGATLAFYYLGFMCVRGEYTCSDSMSGDQFFKKAYPGLLELAEKGNVRAQTALSSLYRYGWGAEKDSVKSLTWNKTAAEQGFPRAIYNQGLLCYNGIGVEKDYDQARLWFEKLASTGDEKARFQIANMYYNGHGYEKDVDEAMRIFHQLQAPNRIYEQRIREGDYVIPNMLPPKYVLNIEEGSCGECCLWSILQAMGLDATQIEINKAGGDPGRGLHFDELFLAAMEYGIEYIELSKSVNTSDCELTAEKYRAFLYEDILTAVKKSNPVLIGIKVYPTRHPEWICDHFVLVVGYNQNTDEVIFNDFQKRKRIVCEQLISCTEVGYSFINDWNYVLAIEFLAITKD